MVAEMEGDFNQKVTVLTNVVVQALISVKQKVYTMVRTHPRTNRQEKVVLLNPSECTKSSCIQCFKNECQTY